VVEELTALEHYVAVMVNNQKIRIPLRNIIYIYTQQRKLHIFTVGGEIVSNDTFEKIHAQLKDHRDFYTPHRSYIVNLRHVNDYTKNTVYCECLGEVHRVYLSRRKYDDFIKTFMQWIGEK
jgi:DNA-binding LytR/AlgR family response regulator